MNNYTIIIPSKNHSNLIACMEAFRAAGELGDVIVVDDSDEVLAGVNLGRLAELGMNRLAFVPGVKPFCFGANINRGIGAIERRVIGQKDGQDVLGPLDDVVLLNDDAVLETKNGFAALAEASLFNPRMAVIAAAVSGYGNLCQPVAEELREEMISDRYVRPLRMAPFVCVYIPRGALDQVGVLDDRFCGFVNTAPIICPQCGWGHSGLDEAGQPFKLAPRPYSVFRCGQCPMTVQVPTEEVYGGEDDDYCYRVRKAGLQVGVFDGCVVNHATLPSTFRPDGRGRSIAGARARFFQIHQIAMGAA